MNIVIVDDDSLKVEKIKRVFDGFTSEPLVFEVGYSVADALTLLKKRKFDLMLLDLNLPVRNNDYPRKDGGVRLLKELKRNLKLQKPSFIIGLTGHSDLKNANKSYFEIEGWTLFEIDNKSFDWEEAILNKVNHIHNTKPSKKNGNPKKESKSSRDPDRRTISIVMFWSIICPVTTAAFFLGLYLGQAKFDKEKSDLYEENRLLRKRIESQKDLTKQKSDIRS